MGKKKNRSLVDQLIEFPKLLIAAVNGPAYGFAVTHLALCDVVYTVPHATFTTPFMKLGTKAKKKRKVTLFIFLTIIMNSHFSILLPISVC